MADVNELRLRARVAETRSLAVRATSPVDRVLHYPGQPDNARMPDLDESGWAPVVPGAVWGGPDPWAWFRIQFRVPTGWAGARVRLDLPLGGQGMLYLDGAPWQGLDGNHRTTVIPPALCDGRPHLAAVECYAVAGTTEPGIPGQTFAIGECRLALIDEDVEGFSYDLLVGTDALRVLPEDAPERAPLFELLLRAENLVNRLHPDSEAFLTSVRSARAFLAERLPALAAASAPGRPRILAVGHAHIDTAWLWPLAQTRRKVARSWSTALRLMERYPSFHFLCSQPQQYRWIEQDEPDIYRQILERAREGRWEPTGGLWVEPDGNLPSGESWVRQLLYGQRYFEQHFGHRCRIVWLPDSFGYSGALPQLLRSAGVHTIVTTKLSWNTTDRMPHDTLRWRGIDGSEVMGYFITAGVDWREEDWLADPDAPLRNIATYNGHMTAPELVSAWTRYQDKALNNEILYAFGWGDGGGGPTERMLEFADRIADYPGLPRLTQGSAEQFLTALRDRIWDHPRTAVWEGELYLEYHRGTYTSQAGVKWGNRRSEHTLHDAELWTSWAALLGAATADWQRTLAECWETVLLNQFHDILPGSSVPEVYVDQRRDHARVLSLAGSVLNEAQDLIAGQLEVSRPALAVFNGLPWSREEPVEVDLTLPDGYVPIDATGERLLTQAIDDGEGRSSLLIDDMYLPALGVQIVGLSTPRGSASDPDRLISATERLLENDYFRLELDDTGAFASLYDKRFDRQVLAPGGGGNRLVAFEDKPISFDAWDIDQFYTEKSYPLDMVDEWQVVEHGPIRAGVAITRRWEGSVIRQRILLYRFLPRIDIQTTIGWHHRQVLLKAAFPLAVHATQASYECAFGYVQRPTHRNTSWDAARFEVPGHRWADLSETGYGVSLLNDGKYGHDCLGNVLRLTLLKSAIDPDPQADEGIHRFSYALLPHGPEWTIADTVCAAYAFNLPAHARLLEPRSAPARGMSLGKGGSLVYTDSSHAVIDIVKPAEDGDGLIVRVYDCANQRGAIRLHFILPLESAIPVSILEDVDKEAAPITVADNVLHFDLLPFQVRSFRVRLRA